MADAEAPKKRDWVQLGLQNVLAPILVGVVLAGFGYFIQQNIQSIQSQVSDERARDAALQTYISSMDDLLIKQNINTVNPTIAMALLRGESVSVLRELDGKRRFTVLRFLHDSGLLSISNPPIAMTNALGILDGADLTDLNLPGTDASTGILLQDADLTGVDMTGAILSYANLTNSYLVNAKLENSQFDHAVFNSAHLSGSKLIKATLTSANLNNADLSGADLTGATLSGAILTTAKLRGTNFTGATLTGADLTDVDLTGAIISQDQLKATKTYSGATMPDGTVQQ